MPSIHDLQDRHAEIDAREGQYLSFPDLWRLEGGDILCAYREADAHVPARRRLLMKRSADGGRTWGASRVLHPETGHCPRFCEPEAGRLLIMDDALRLLHESPDQGRTWSHAPYFGMPPGVPDRILDAGGGTWLCSSHRHQGEVNPVAGQKPAVQGVFASRDRGRSWERIAVMGGDPNLVLCEASMTRLPGGSILAMLRENSQVFEPMYVCRSDDQGRTWSAPRPTCLIGHRPTLGLARDGDLLVTYRNRGPAGGTAAWKGSPESLEGFAVHGPAHHGPEPPLTSGGLRLEPGDDGRPMAYALRPLTDPVHAQAALEAVVMGISENDGGGLLRLGVSWRVLADRMIPLLPDEGAPGADDVPRGLSVPLPRGAFNTVRLEYDSGRLDIAVNGRRAAALDLNPASVRRRGVLFGAAPGAGQASLWRRVSQSIIEPSGQKTYAWEWRTAHGQPDARARSGVLELAADHGAAWCDYGYSGWVETGDGEFLCACHHADASAPGYRPGETSHIRATRFFASDFAT